MSVSELATSAGVGRTVLYTLLKTLGQRGEITGEGLPGGTTGYRLAPPGARGAGRRGAAAARRRLP